LCVFVPAVRHDSSGTTWGNGPAAGTSISVDRFYVARPSARAFEVSVQPNVRLHDILTVSLGAGTIDHVVNDTGAAVSSAAIGVPSYIPSFP
jgi:hypothetical protein